MNKNIREKFEIANERIINGEKLTHMVVAVVLPTSGVELRTINEFVLCNRCGKEQSYDRVVYDGN